LFGKAESKELGAEDIENADTQKSNAELLSGLFGVSTKEQNNNFQKTSNQSKKKDSHARSGLVLNKLRTIPSQFLERTTGGVTKVLAKGLKDSGLELRDCVSVLKDSGLLVLVDGLETGVDASGKKPSQYFLVKSDLLDER